MGEISPHTEGGIHVMLAKCVTFLHAVQVGKISFIDLAGSERGADTFDNNRQTRLEVGHGLVESTGFCLL